MKGLRWTFLFMVVLAVALAVMDYRREHQHDDDTYLEQLNHTIACADWNLYEDSAYGYQMHYPSCFIPVQADSDEEGEVRYVYMEEVTPMRSINYMTLEITTEECHDTLNPYRDIQRMAKDIGGICLRQSPTEYILSAELESRNPQVTAYRISAKYVLRQRLWFVETFIYPEDFTPAVQRIVQKVKEWHPFPQ